MRVGLPQAFQDMLRPSAERQRAKTPRSEIAVIAALFLLSIALNYSMHYNYPLPIHSDEYDHLATVAEMERTEGRVLYDPYITQYRFAVRNLELNYDVFLLVFRQFTGIDFTLIPLVIPPILTFLMSLSAFVLVKFLTGKRFAALLSAVFVLFLHNNIAFLGYWILVPMAMGLAAIPVMAYLFLRGMDSWAYFLLLLAVFINITLTHAVYAVIFIPVFALYFISSPRGLKKNLPKIALGTAVLIALSARFVQWDFINPALTLQRITDFLVWNYGDTTAAYPLIPYVTPLTFTLSLAGLGWLLLPLVRAALAGRKTAAGSGTARAGAKETAGSRTASALPKSDAYSSALHNARMHFPMLVLFFITLLFLVRAYADSSGVCLLGPCRRTTPAFAVMALIAAGIGLFAIINALSKIAAQVPPHASRVLHAIVIFGLAVFLLQQLTAEPYTNRAGFYHNIELGEVDAIRWVAKNSHADFVVMALPWAAKPVYLISERKVTETGAARLGASLQSLQDIIDFPTASCEEREKAVIKYNPDVIYGGEAYIDCEFLDLAYSKGGYHVYVPNR